MEVATSIQSTNFINSQKLNDMAELNSGMVNYDSVVDIHDMHEKKHSSRTATWVWVIIGILVILAILWVAHKFSHDRNKGHENAHSYELGKIKGTEVEQTYELHETQKYERQDAMKIAFLEGRLCGGGYPEYGRGERGEHGRDGHHGCGCTSTRFNKIDNFTLDTTTAQAVTRCG